MAIVTDRVPSNEARVMRDACLRLDGHGARQTAFSPVEMPHPSLAPIS
jgi:hypothetical protein